MRRLLFGLAIASIAALLPCRVHAGDQQVAQHIVQQLQEQKADGKLKGFGIDLEVESGIVWLKGHVRSQQQQALVLDIARRVDGVKQVINDIEIKARAPSKTSRSKTTAQPALLRSETGRGLLKKPGELLGGLHDSMQQALRPGAEEARDKPDKTERARPAKPNSPQKAKGLLASLRTSVTEAFSPASETKQQPPKKTRHQTARSMPKLRQAQLARGSSAKPTPAKAKPTPAQTSQAKPATGQRRNTSRSQASRPSGPPAVSSDERLAKTIVEKLRVQKDRGILKDFDVDLQVNDRVVWVSGHVASETQRNLVLDVSRRVRGVKKVVNDLDVGRGTPAQVVSSSPKATAPVSQEPEPTEAKQSAAPNKPTPAAPARTEQAGQTGPTGTVAAHSRAPAPFQYAPNGSARQQRAASPVPFAPAQSAAYQQQAMGQPVPETPAAQGVARARFDHPTMPGYAWPSYAAYPNYGAVTYPRQYSPTAWPYIGPFYPYPQVPLGWRKVSLEWDDGWWMLDFKSQ